MHCEEEYSKNEKSPVTASGCLANPLEVEVTRLHDFLYEPEDQQPPEEKKPGFWKSIFGEKKCNTCSQKKSECICKSKKKKKHRGAEKGTEHFKRDENSKAMNCSAYGTSKEISKNGNCPTKCSLPMNQGCGCHLYFCIDSKRKKQPIKSKNNKNKQNEKIKTEREPFAQTWCDEACHEAVPNVTIFCDESKDGLEIPKNNIQTSNFPTSKTNFKPNYGKQMDNVSKSIERNQTRPFSFLSSEKSVFQFGNCDKNFIDINTMDKPRVKDIETNNGPSVFAFQNKIGQSSLFGSVVKEENVFFDNSIPTNKLLKKNDVLDQNESDKKQSPFKDMNKDLDVVCGFTDELNKTEIKVSSLKINSTKSFETLDKKPKFQELSTRESEEDSIITKEYISLNKSRKKTRKSTAKSGLFVRNSMITLRKERRQSELEGRVSLILDKLGNIENKITELEKMTNKEKENNITMGIICEGKQSKVAIKFDNQSKKVVSENQQNFVGPSGDKSNKTIQITSNNESIYLKTPGEVKIVKSKQRDEDSSNRSKQVIYENAYKMDAHTIGSSIQCKNPKVVVSYQKPELLCKNPHCSGKWRRISEELKKSNLDVVKCETCGRIK